jgi:hypothetical protein
VSGTGIESFDRGERAEDRPGLLCSSQMLVIPELNAAAKNPITDVAYLAELTNRTLTQFADVTLRRDFCCFDG